MVIIKLDGGMGNQLFQYAVGKYLSQKLNAVLKLDTDIYTADNKRQYSLHHFGIKEVFSTSKEKKILKKKEYIRQKLKIIGIRIEPYWYTEKKLDYDDYVQLLTDNIYLEGFWQSEKYFKPVEDILRKEFVVNDPPVGLNKEYLERIRSVNAISVHIRRGDYVTDEVTNAIHGVCDIDYYRKAINHIAAEVSMPHFFIFSDDIGWTKNNIVIDKYPVDYVEHNMIAEHEDLRLMSSCRHHIIANSSFSWWGAWLNNYTGKKVIAPKKWFRSLLFNNDIIPDGWMTL